MFFELALIGTTASGKTALANALALEFGAVVLSLDSLCVYREINIANAKTSPQDLARMDYFGVNLLSVRERFNVALFIKEYERAKRHARAQGKALIITGGTGFYLKTMLDGLSEKVEEGPVFLSNDEIYALRCELDPHFRVEKNDSYRLKKWLNIYESTGQIPSEFLQNTRQKGVLEGIEIYELLWEREDLKNKIAKRTKMMLKNGLLEEASYLFKNFDGNLKPLNSIGLKESRDFLEGKISRDELEIRINTHTAQLAKRQRTFNKKFSAKPLNHQNALTILRSKF
ncbi:tRNA (adenosine(37)-N6)-dimethylallyltransferase MiaA [Campylobacter sp.]|uniref:tRNA (adenosine(37)-N6)-dimethylallyltransferase MiaA n=1 Tax=Campylobacter sp. TaxID=205 RepID=UPI0026DB7665|nr:tRNA (adenosine(37)-N6)-dimethylallyltransferase MiaA [Campylobacter sp.]MDO4673593.1 tRNA (adenosine(37)-N6)-dimethylallyltransferase MiaA [Campylobacter sp.]